MRYKATTTNEQSAFKGYANSYAITNIRVRGIKALQYLKYQDLRLKEYLRKQWNEGYATGLRHFEEQKD